VEDLSVADIRRILVAVDFSEHSRRALDDAIALAKKFGAELHLLHCYQVYPVEAVGYPYYVAVPESYDRAIQEGARAQLSSWLEKVSAQGVRAEQHLEVDHPSHGIVALAEKLSADLIVVGTYGLTGLKHALLGSVAERVIRHAPCPVLTVK
jgi:nucleotide-binding universal stress UspA family protein